MAKMIIGGKKVDAKSGKTMPIVNPANGQVIDEIPAANKEDIDICMEEALKAQKIWSRVPLHERGEILYKFVELVKDNKGELSLLLSQENGKPIVEAQNEINNIPIAFKAFVEKAKHKYGEVIPPGTEAGQEHTIQFTVREPVGVVGCIIPFNFPCDLFDQKVAPSLIMGNAVIVKPPEDNSLTLIRLVELLQEAGVTPGAISAVTGKGEEAGAALAQHPDLGLISLTGSTEVGIITAESAAKNLTPAALELGGNDAFIVLADADIDLAVEEIVWGRMYNTGQVCCASKRFLVANEIKEEFIKTLVTRLNKLKVGDPAKEDTEIGCLICERAANEVEKQVDLTVQQGAKIALGGKRNGAFYDPTVLVDVTKDMDVAKDMEIFGPVIPVIGFDTVEEAVAVANNSKFGLSSCVFSKNINQAMKVAYAMEAGGAVINGASFFRSFEMPFGGYKMSGIGNEGVMSSLEEVTKTKTVVLKNVLA